MSQILTLYEEEGLTVDETLVGQYLRNERVVKEFTAYYDLYQKYKKNYHVEEILKGEAPEEAFIRAKAASFDERLSLLSMLMDKMLGEIRERMETADYLNDLMVPLKALRGLAEKGGEMAAVTEMMERQAEGKKKLADSLRKANSLSDGDWRKHRAVIQFLERTKKELYAGDAETAADAFGQIKKKFEAEVAAMKSETAVTKERLHGLFTFVETAFEEGNEMLILVTELTVNTAGARFIATFGCEDYQKHNEALRLSERQESLVHEIEKLEL